MCAHIVRHLASVDIVYGGKSINTVHRPATHYKALLLSCGRNHQATHCSTWLNTYIHNAISITKSRYFIIYLITMHNTNSSELHSTAVLQVRRMQCTLINVLILFFWYAPFCNVLHITCCVRCAMQYEKCPFSNVLQACCCVICSMCYILCAMLCAKCAYLSCSEHMLQCTMAFCARRYVICAVRNVHMSSCFVSFL